MRSPFFKTMAKKPNPKLYQSERADLYFQRRNRRGTIPVYLAGAVIAALFALMNMRAGHSPVYFAVSAVLIGLAIWQFIYTRQAVVEASEVDDRFNKISEETQLLKYAATESEMYLETFEALEKYTLTGYTNRSIRDTAALLRADSSDDTGRSSHMQMSCLTFDKLSLLSFTIIRSLIEQKESQDQIIWPYTQISDVHIENLKLSCPLEPGGENTVKRVFPVIVIESRELEEKQSFAFSEQCRESAEQFVQILKTRSQMN